MIHVLKRIKKVFRNFVLICPSFLPKLWINYIKIINFGIQFTCLFDLNPNFLNKLPPEDVVRGEQRKLGQINTKFRKTFLILFKILYSIYLLDWLFEAVRTNPWYGMANLIYNNLLNLILGRVMLSRSNFSDVLPSWEAEANNKDETEC